MLEFCHVAVLDLLCVYMLWDISITIAHFTVLLGQNSDMADIPKQDEMVYLCFNCLAGLACISAHFPPVQPGCVGLGSLLVLSFPSVKLSSFPLFS